MYRTEMPYTLTFLRHGKLNLPYQDHAEIPFDIFADLGSGKLNPPIDTAFADATIRSFAKKTTFTPETSILSSPSRRCLETATRFTSVVGDRLLKPIQPTPDLVEVAFDLQILNTNNRIADALAAHNIAIANTAVFEGMLSGTGCEHVRDAYARVERVFEIIRNETSPVVCFTHDFLMRVIQIYIHRGGASFSEVTLADLLETKRNTYLNGFQTDSDLTVFKPFPL